MKWSLTAKGDDVPRGYIVCNADEMEPGTFKDRLLMEQQPHLLIEGMILAGYANRSKQGYIFLRGEYHRAAASILRALDDARADGWLGADVRGSGWDFDIALHTGAGRYICGEETALINSLEGKRANPRAKPPFPGQSGAWGCPPWSITSRPCATCRASSTTAPTGSRRSPASAAATAAPSSTAPRARSSARGCGSCRWAPPGVSCSRSPAACAMG